MSEDLIFECLSQNADLSDEIEKQIAASRKAIRSRLQRASSNVLANRKALKEDVLRTDSLVQQSVQQFDRFEQSVLPLVTAHLNEVECLIQLQEQQLQENANPCRTEQPGGMLTEQVVSDQLTVEKDDEEKLSDVAPEYLVQGRDIISRDMKDDYPVGSEPEEADVQPLSFSFPVCRVSKSCLAMLDLVLQLLSDAEFCEYPHRQVVLQNTAKKLMQMFLIGMPVKHNAGVEQDEQLAALFHNNCFFAAHFLLTSPQIQDSAADCSSLISEFQSLGESAVRLWTERNRAAIEDHFQNPEVIQCLIDSHVKGNSTEPFEQAVNKCVNLLRNMRDNWSDILPHNVYNNLAASLMLVILDEIMRLVLMLEDITSRSAEDIAHIMSSLRKDLPAILREPHEGIPALLPNSFQFLELERMLTSSLAETVSRWGGGFGPLSVAFRADQVKKMIRALFQNNELRASALNKIREL